MCYYIHSTCTISKTAHCRLLLSAILNSSYYKYHYVTLVTPKSLPLLIGLPLTKENILKFTSSDGVFKKWKNLGKVGFCLPNGELEKIESTKASDEECFGMMIDVWLQGVGHPYSWRMLIFALDKIQETGLADKLIQFAEPQMGKYHH